MKIQGLPTLLDAGNNDPPKIAVSKNQWLSGFKWNRLLASSESHPVWFDSNASFRKQQLGHKADDSHAGEFIAHREATHSVEAPRTL
jgi:hypothetical protein